MNDIKKMFSDVIEKAKQDEEAISDNSILNTKIVSSLDHYRICPFRSLDVEDCPMCKMERFK
tara:strand:+ start:528 stop:713 length:186 start_codon:yes stop_codon:yes gene_type:complete